MNYYRRMEIKRFLKVTILFTSLLGLLNACVKDQTSGWCKKQGAKTLRERTYSASKFHTVDKMIRAGDEGQVALFAHRGGFHCEEADKAPENSLATIEKSVRMGFDGYETDLWRTSDGHYVIHHDGTLDRTTTGTGRVSEHSLEQIQKLHLKYPSGKVSQEKVPTLQEFLLRCKGRIIPLIEPKGVSHEHFQEILQIVKEEGLTGQVLFWATWKQESIEIYEKHLNSGWDEIRKCLVWRVKTYEEFQDLIARFRPLLVDLAPPMKRMELEKLFSSLPPKKHLALVDKVIPTKTNVMVSRIITNSYLDILYERGVRVFMSRNPEPQLLHLVEKGLHP